MTMKEFADKYGEILYKKNSTEYFKELEQKINSLKVDSRPIKLYEKIEIWKLIESKIRELNTKYIYENENNGLLTLISATIRTLESDNEVE